MNDTKGTKPQITGKQVFSRYFKVIRRYPKSAISILIFAFLAMGASNIIQPIVYGELIDVINGGGATKDVLIQLVVQLIVISVLAQFAFRINDVIFRYFFTNIERDLRDEAFEKMTEHSFTFFREMFSGSLIARTGRYVNAFERIFIGIVWDMWVPAIVMVGTFTVLSMRSPLIGGMLIVWSAVYFIVSTIFVRKKMQYDEKTAEADSAVTARLSDVITNVLNLKMFATRDTELKYFKSVTHDAYVATNNSWRFQNIIFATQSILLSIIELASIAGAVYLWYIGMVTPGLVVIILLYLNTLFHNLFGLTNAISRIGKSVAEAIEMIEVFEAPLGIKDPVVPEQNRITHGAISFNGVRFDYHNDSPVLKDFTLSIKAGEKVALVGKSGVGKTTIINLLLRFLDIQQGVISIDGQNITHITQDSLRSKIAFVPQDPLLFHRTLRENITYGNPDATEGDVIEVAKKAHAHDFIMQTPEKYDTLVGERGVKLSGGERQRVAIARAMLKRAPILVLDEATSALDSVSERYIQDAFSTLMEGKTTIVIAHRLSTVQKMDRIIVLDENGIAEEGTHSQLVEKDGLYATFWKEQSSGFIE